MRGSKFMIIGMLLVLVIFAAGCGPTTDVSGRQGIFFGGSDGVSIEFVDASPPSQINQGQVVPVKVLLRNQGETDLAAGVAKVKLFGINLDDYGLSDKYFSSISELKGKDDLNPEGRQQEVSLGTLQYNKEVINTEPARLRAKVCYPYQTLVKADVCLKSASARESGSGEGICDIAGNKITSGSVSSAPIQVISLTEKEWGNNQLRFEIIIQNNKGGDVYSREISCEDIEDSSKKMNNKNKLKLEISSPNNVICSFNDAESNEGIVKLDDSGKATLLCEKTVSDVYEQKMDITLDYLYVDSIKKDLTIYEAASTA